MFYNFEKMDAREFAENKNYLFSQLAPNATCVYCNCILNNIQNSHSCRSVDHIVPVSLGGGPELKNLVVCCASCNHRKSNYKEVMFYRLINPQSLQDNEASSLSKVMTSSMKMQILQKALSDFNSTGMSFENSILNNYEYLFVKGYCNRVIKELRKQDSIEAELEHLKLKISHQIQKLETNKKIVKDIKYDRIVKKFF